MKVVLIPGWHEGADHMRPFIDGRHGLEGLAAFGFDCTVFPEGSDALRPRVDRFAAFLEALRIREPEAFPVATVGYSAGGLINRAFLKAYPERAGEVAATIQIGTPNTGLISNYVANVLRLAGIPHRVLNDLDVASEFLTWLNGTSGHWVPEGPKGKSRWHLIGAPWVAPEGHRILSIVGLMPKYKSESDGVVMVESATLEGTLPSAVIDDPMANHLNLGVIFNLVAFLARGFRTDDRIWRREVEIIARYLRGEPLA